MSRFDPIVRRYMPELDSVRGTAILLVLFYHGIAPPAGQPMSGMETLILKISGYGWAGVNLFFVLSGFLITGILIDSKSETCYYQSFYARRALRILPALWCILFLLLACGWISVRFFAVSGLFLANTAPLLGIPLQYGPLWSLAVEEHFYMVWPACIKEFSRRSWILCCGLIFLLTPVLRWVEFVEAGRPEQFVSLYTWCNLDGLALGALLAIWVRGQSFDRAKLSYAALPLVTVGVVAFAILKRDRVAQSALSLSACNIAALGVLSCVLIIGTGRWKKLVDRPMLRFFGFISYGLYLIHVFVFKVTDVALGRWWRIVQSWHSPVFAMLLRFLVGSMLAIGIAFLSRRSLEAFFLGMRPRQPNRHREPQFVELDARELDAGPEICVADRVRSV